MAAGVQVLRREEGPDRFLYRATLTKLVLYMVLWLLLPFFHSDVGGRATYAPSFWMTQTGAVILYYWLTLQLGFLVSPAGKLQMALAAASETGEDAA